MSAHHPFLVDVDMDMVVLIHTETGHVTSLTTDQTAALLDDLEDATQGARGFTHYNGPDETWTAMEER